MDPANEPKSENDTPQNMLSTGRQSAPRTVFVTQLKCTGLEEHRYFVKIRASNRPEPVVTPVARRTKEPEWEGPFSINGTEASVLSFQVWIKHTIKSDEPLAEGNIDLTALGTGVLNHWEQLLVYVDDTKKKDASISASVTVVAGGPVTPVVDAQDGVQPADHEPSVERGQSNGLFDDTGVAAQAVHAAGRVAADRQASSPRVVIEEAGIAEDLGGAAGHVSDTIKLLTPILKKLRLFVTVTDSISSIHPYAKIAMTVIGAIPKVIVTQSEKDKSVVSLVQCIGEALDLMQTTKDLSEDGHRLRVAILIAAQIVNCGDFVNKYFKTEGFARRLVKNLAVNTGAVVAAYKERLGELMDQFQTGQIIATRIIAHRMYTSVVELDGKITLNSIRYAEGAGYDPGKGCLPGTRRKLISRIHDWACTHGDRDSKPVLLLSGVAGAGKSAVAHALAAMFDDRACLGSFFGFSSSDQRRTPDTLFPNIARDLAAFNAEWEKALLTELAGRRNIPSLLTSTSLSLQFETFLLGPARRIQGQIVGPILIVIDALDESGDAANRSELLRFLGRLHEMPSNFRFLVTSRSEPDVHNALLRRDAIQHKDMSQLDDGETDVDITRYIQHEDMSQLDEGETDVDITCYIEHELRELFSSHQNRYRQESVKKLVSCSDQSFQWASTACKFIRGVGQTHEYDWRDRLEGWISAPTLHS
ncbi:hypothetical protein PUNSTDRAFT_135002 [Punctularia strigosozonata HHB-11173 SS5]|uniref:uncharacterized protein n=1 Tax=Punctularia strigosozonata (strain HHB-11173) TaxID=741275 RepID=UPI0004418641|nr:uncharacterized protein PUNSTDRAFT_135002 [Punctularia strigosozonata HHB-11173 SS5]EIN08626.1 hypothetical protein PUNSTDRAFT_135002 [Punctularia strigosozonata HHB-11173 SS5]